MATLQLLRVQCISTGTSFGDDIRITVDGEEAGGEHNFERGQTRDYTEFAFSAFNDDDTARVDFFEDGDPSAVVEISMLKKGRNRTMVEIKTDGLYLFT